MTNITSNDTGVHIRFPGWEAIMAGRASLNVPRAAVLSVSAEPGWTSEILGARSGLVISGFRKLGVFTHPRGTRRLVSMKRGLPLLRLTVDRTQVGFDEILLSTPDADRIAVSVRSERRA
ncbi:hypothetical protein [Pseudoclavibacter sp. 13-3]|uniref:hypothetical protein n=1 Tax=Pseudoclavibacter sp. 13-3 TaxID=2901228 RepID=UPI001E60E960|nr:hypothetical protein [Pseudoclavibacter sp. 13-3]MCD7102076.1 hypothetical protein [Pseudoclavibacter sp. 13-3]